MSMTNTSQRSHTSAVNSGTTRLTEPLYVMPALPLLVRPSEASRQTVELVRREVAAQPPAQKPPPALEHVTRGRERGEVAVNREVRAVPSVNVQQAVGGRAVAEAPCATPKPPPAKAPSASPKLFRAQALAAQARGERAGVIVRVTSGSRWALLLTLASAVLAASLFAAFGQVEERAAARGVLRASFGVQPVIPLVAGTLREVMVQPGAEVREGEVIARLETAALEVSLQEAEQQLATIAAQWSTTRASLEARHRESVALLEARLLLLERRRARSGQRLSRRGARAERLRAPELASVLEQDVRDRTAEEVESARDELLHVAEELSAVRLQISAQNGELEQRIAAGEERVAAARTERDAARALLQQTELRAPVSGKLESLRAHAGQVVQAGEWIARVVRDETPRDLVVFVRERDAAFLEKGAQASVEVDQLPLGEFGVGHAHVSRIGAELADRAELTAALGEAAPEGSHVRVELQLDEQATPSAIRAKLRSGTLVTARITLRDRRLLGILFEPARRWLY